jgi:hypothetical protein
MADSPVFEFVCTEIEQRTSLGRLEARGTVRLALKEAGLAASSVSVREMQVVLERVLPAALASRGIEGGTDLCGAIRAGAARLQDAGSSTETPEAIFGRLGG